MMGRRARSRPPPTPDASGAKRDPGSARAARKHPKEGWSESVMEQQSKKTMRHFYCRDVLWETFEQMANDFDCSIDYLVNEAMRYYARSKNYQSPGGQPMTGGQPVNNANSGNSGPNNYPGPGGAAKG